MARLIHRTLAAAALAAMFLMSPAAPAAQGGASGSGVDEEQLVRRLKREIMDEIRNSDFLAEQIRKGIEAYIERQRRAARGASEQAAMAKAKRVRPVSSDRDHILGNPDAEISLIEYSDFECPFCKRFHPAARQLVEAFPDTVNWVYRHFPLDFHKPGAQKQAEAAECAADLGGNEAFWRYADLIYERTRSNGNGFPIMGLVPLAGEIGLDRGAFKSCLDSGKFTNRVNSDFREGAEAGVSGTPGNILINNRTKAVIPRMGAVPFAMLKADVQRLRQ